MLRSKRSCPQVQKWCIFLFQHFHQESWRSALVPEIAESHVIENTQQHKWTVNIIEAIPRITMVFVFYGLNDIRVKIIAFIVQKGTMIC
jgi:hypothetical protein